MPGLHNQPKTNTTPKSRKSVFETPNVPIKEVRGAVLDNTKSLRVRLEAIGQARLLALGGENISMASKPVPLVLNPSKGNEFSLQEEDTIMLDGRSRIEAPRWQATLRGLLKGKNKQGMKEWMLTAEEILDSVKETVYGSDFVEEHESQLIEDLCSLHESLEEMCNWAPPTDGTPDDDVAWWIMEGESLHEKAQALSVDLSDILVILGGA